MECVSVNDLIFIVFLLTYNKECIFVRVWLILIPIKINILLLEKNTISKKNWLLEESVKFGKDLKDLENITNDL